MPLFCTHRHVLLLPIRWPWRAAPVPSALPPEPAAANAASPSPAAPLPAAQVRSTSKAKGDAAEGVALAHLQARGLRLVARNWRAPGRGAVELDLVMQAGDGTLVFVEVRARRSGSHGGAGGSVTASKQRRTVRAAQHFLQHAWAKGMRELPPCRFDVVLIEGEGAGQRLEWLQAAFDAGG